MEMASPSLLGLPAELIVKIIDEIPPQDHLKFALGSKRIYHLSADVLEAHRREHKKHSLSSDLHPLTVPQLLENILSDPISAWHIRDLEFWGLRRSWPQWVVQEPGSENNDFVPDEEPESLVDGNEPARAAYVFTDDGIDGLRACCINQLGYNEQVADKLISKVKKGEEEPLKLLIVALAPGLRSVKIPSVYLGSQIHRPAMSHPLNLLSEALTMRRVSHNMWPPGFASLRSISIGVRISTVRGFVYPLPFIAPLFLLPNLEYIYLDHPYSSYEPAQTRFHFPRRISTVKHVHLTSSDLESNEMSELLAGIAKLHSFSLQSLQRNGSDVIRLLTLYHSESLEYLDMCDTDVLQRLYERHFSRLSINGMSMFSKLRYIAIDLLVLLHQHIETRYSNPGQLVTLKPNVDVDRIDLAAMLPLTIEYIAFKISSANYLLTTPVADAISALVTKAIHSRAFPKLKAVFFEGICPRKASAANPNPYSQTDIPWFEDAIAAGRENKVEVCTVWTHPGRQMKTRKDQLGIPRATTKGDMRTDPRNE